MATSNEAIRERALAVLHGSGWADHPIGTALHMSVKLVRAWRESHGLKRNETRKIDAAEAYALYSAGATDREMGRLFNVERTAVTHWRKRRGLPTNHIATPPLTKAEVRQAKNMLRAGATRRQIATELGISVPHGLHRIQRIREQMSHPGMRKTGCNNYTLRARVVKDPSIRTRIAHALGSIPNDVKEEAISELYCAVLDGRVLPSQIEAQAPHYRNSAWTMMGSAFGARSLDAVNDDGFSLGDLLDDPDALESLEAAAELAYEMDD